MRVTIWNENDRAFDPYPNGINAAITEFLQKTGEFDVRTALQTDTDQGLSDEVLNNTDVLVYWGHIYHHLVEEHNVERLARRVLGGMGLILLHSAHASKIMARLLGTETGRLRWRDGDREIVWCIEPHHEIAQGVPEYINIPESEMYGEHFQIPAPDELVFISWFSGGEVFRSGCTWRRGAGKIFFFSPGHESNPIYHMPEIQRVIINALRWAQPTERPPVPTGHQPNPPVHL